MRYLLKEGQEVTIKATGKKGTVKYDYEDLIYLVGIPEPFTIDQLQA